MVEPRVESEEKEKTGSPFLTKSEKIMLKTRRG
jgi:hypothetical protein